MATPIRDFGRDQFYHVYNRGNRKQPVFIDSSDYQYWLEKLVYNLAKYDCDLLAYCLMSNHYHLLLHQKSDQAITTPMLASSVSYAKRFNKKYDTVGRIFQDRYQARLVSSDADLMNVSRYIHLNPRDFTDYEAYPWSSFKEFKTGQLVYCNPTQVLAHFSASTEYIQFLADYPWGKAGSTPGVELGLTVGL